MATILPYIQDDAFQPDDVKAMSMALDDLCKELKLDGNASALRFFFNLTLDRPDLAKQRWRKGWCAGRAF